MPIGKNAIKRVADSTKKEAQAKAAEVTPAPEKNAKKPAAPKAAPKTAAAKPVAKAAPETKKDGFNRINIGGELPIYLL